MPKRTKAIAAPTAKKTLGIKYGFSGKLEKHEAIVTEGSTLFELKKQICEQLNLERYFLFVNDWDNEIMGDLEKEKQVVMEIRNNTLHVKIGDRKDLQKFSNFFIASLAKRSPHRPPLPRIVDKTFNMEYNDDRKNLAKFSNFVKTCRDDYDYSGSFYSPYFTMVQAAGFGKSRLLCEYSKTNNLLYGCLRDPKIAGYPFATPNLRDIFEGFRTREHYDRFVLCIRSVVLSLETGIVPFDTKDNSKEHENIWQRIFDLYNSNQETSNIPFDKGSSQWTVVFDEASFLVDSDPYRVSHLLMLREAFQKGIRESNTRIMFVLIDTNPIIAGFVPEIVFGPTSRSCSEKLLAPYWKIDTLYLKPFDLTERATQEQVSLKNLDRICSGRPLWRALVINDGLESALKKAKEKISFGKLVIPYVLKKDYEIMKPDFISASLAVCSCRFAIQSILKNSLSNLMVQYHLAVCTKISEDRKKIRAIYPSEPFLAEASAQLLNQNDEIRKSSINFFLDCTVNGSVSAGSLHETVARICLCLAKDFACPTIPATIKYSVQVLVNDFLKSLMKDPPKLDGFWSEALVNFTHFSYYASEVHLECLENFYASFCALATFESQSGVDLVIPAMNGKTLCLLLINLKRTASDFERESILSDLKRNPFKVSSGLKQIQVLPIYLQLGSAKKPQDFVQPSDRLSIWLDDLNDRILNSFSVRDFLSKRSGMAGLYEQDEERDDRFIETTGLLMFNSKDLLFACCNCTRGDCSNCVCNEKFKDLKVKCNDDCSCNKDTCSILNPTTEQHEKKKRKCSACQTEGHNKSSKLCPKNAIN